jgi:hypothetical protein
MLRCRKEGSREVAAEGGILGELRLGQKRDFVPQIRREAGFRSCCVHAKAAIDGENPSASGLDEAVRAHVGAAAVAVRNAQINGPAALERSIQPRPK